MGGGGGPLPCGMGGHDEAEGKVNVIHPFPEEKGQCLFVKLLKRESVKYSELSLGKGLLPSPCHTNQTLLANKHHHRLVSALCPTVPLQ
jgi:hypothetical protein